MEVQKLIKTPLFILIKKKNGIRFIFITEFIYNYNDAYDYKLFFAIPRDTSVTQNEMYLDNIRLLYEE